MELNILKRLFKGFPSGSEVKIPSANAGDSDLVLGPRRFTGEGNGSPLQYSSLGNPREKRGGDLLAPVHGVAESSSLVVQWLRIFLLT